MVRKLIVVAVLLFALGVGTCYSGVRHEIAQIPPQQRAQMTDLDWIGVKWVSRGMLVQAVAVALLFVAGVVHFSRRSRPAA